MVTTIISFIIVFGILVFVHEFGHFIMAKKCGIMVREFSIGMGPKIFSYLHNHTTYTIRILPLGGYVRLAGSADDEDDEIKPGTSARLMLDDNGQVIKIDMSSDNSVPGGIPFQIDKADLVNGLWIKGYENGDSADLKKYNVDHDALIVRKDGTELQIAPADVQFQNAPVFKQIVVNAAGIFNNVILAIVAFTVLAFLQGGVATNSNKIFVPHLTSSAAYHSGIRSGDRIVAVDGHKTENFQAIATQIAKKPNQKIDLHVQNKNKNKNITIKTKAQKSQNKEIGVIGISASINKSFSAKLLSGFTKTWTMTTQLFGALWLMVSGHFSLNSLGGPVAIFATTSQAASLGISGIIAFLAWLSINLAVVNLIPIPALDGGKILLNIIQGIRRKRMSEKTEVIITLAGFIFLVILMVLVTWNDIMRYFIH